MAGEPRPLPHAARRASRRRRQAIPDDDGYEGANNVRGSVTFASAGPGTRTTQLFINLQDNVQLDSMGFTPVGVVSAGMHVVDSLESKYGEGAPQGCVRAAATPGGAL